MGIASFVVGLSCLMLSPFFNVFLVLPSILGLVLGIIDTIVKTKNKQSKGLSIAGIVLSSIALVVCAILTIGIYALSNYSTTSTNTSVELISSDIYSSVGNSATSDNIKVDFKNVDLNFKKYNDYAFIPSGYTILKADFEFENVGNTYSLVSYNDFKCYADDFSCDEFYYVDNYFFSESLAPGEKYTASVYFEVPKSATSIDLEYDSNPSKEGKIIFNVKNNTEK